MNTPQKLAFLIPALLFAVVASTAAAGFSLTWSTTDGGGGASTSADGRFSVSGTAGQPDAGSMNDNAGRFALAGGFWSLYALQTPGAPLLSIARTNSNTVAVFWPAPSSGWLLQQNTNSANSVNWSNVAATIQDDGTTKTLLINPSAGNRFYRLFKP